MFKTRLEKEKRNKYMLIFIVNQFKIQIHVFLNRLPRNIIFNTVCVKLYFVFSYRHFDCDCFFKENILCIDYKTAVLVFFFKFYTYSYII